MAQDSENLSYCEDLKCANLSPCMSHTAIVFKRVTSEDELKGIKILQTKNLRANLSQAEIESEGFVTAQYTPEFLVELHSHCPSVIAKIGDTVVGYVIAAARAINIQHKVLRAMFQAIDSHEASKDFNFVLCGQLCVDKPCRGRGLAIELYRHFKKELEGEFDGVVTDISIYNPRSLKAHCKVGFKTIGQMTFEDSLWDLVMWDWRLQNRRSSVV